MPKPVKEMEQSRLVSVPVNLVSFLLLIYIHTHALSIRCCVLTDPTFFPVLTGKVTSVAPRPRGAIQITVSLIKAYKAGRLTITQVGETMSVKLMSQCKKCPLFRKGGLLLIFKFVLSRCWRSAVSSLT